jgi:Fe-S cluster biosynthesis and repair protein YggX
MLINENNLNMLDENAQSYLKEQMEKFFFSVDGAVALDSDKAKMR